MALGGGLSPETSHLELAARIVFDNKSSDPQEEALIHCLLTISTRRDVSDARLGAVEAFLGTGDISLPLLHLCGSTSGVVQSLALHALKTWAEDHEDCLLTCIRADAISLLLSILERSLPTAASEVTAAYSASLAVILLRAMVRQRGDQGAGAFLEAGGVDVLLQLLTQVVLDDRSLCLVLYLMNDVTRRSAELLDEAVAANAVEKIVAVLRQPVSEATKFAALILNRWSLSAPHLPTIREAGSVDALLNALCGACAATQVDPETVAYALSAFAIMTQNSVDAVRTRLLESPVSLAAVSRGIAYYERCFKGVGFPHAMMSMLLQGADSVKLVAALTGAGLLPLWLAARHVGSLLAQRTAQPDALAALQALSDPAQSMEATVALTFLVQQHPGSVFMQPVLEEQRIERLVIGTLNELIAGNLFSSSPVMRAPCQCTVVIPPSTSCDVFDPLLPSGSSGLEAWTTLNEGEPGFDSGAAVMNRRESSGEVISSPSAAGVVEEDSTHLTLPLTPTMMTSSPSPSPPSTTTVGEEVAATLLNGDASSSDVCTAALIRLLSSTCQNDSDDDKTMRMISTPLQLQQHQRRPNTKRQRGSSSPRFQTSPSFKKEDVGLARYDTLCFVVGGKEVHAVGFVLEVHSAFLRGLLSTINDVQERVVVPQLPVFSADTMHRTFEKVVEWCYTCKVEHMDTTSPDDAFDLWALAEFLQIDGLQRYCEAALQRWFSLRPEVVLHSLNLAEAYSSAEPLLARVAQYVLELIMDGERKGAAEEVVMAAAAAGHATSLSTAMAAQVRLQLARTP